MEIIGSLGFGVQVSTTASSRSERRKFPKSQIECLEMSRNFLNFFLDYATLFLVIHQLEQSKKDEQL